MREIATRQPRPQRREPPRLVRARVPAPAPVPHPLREASPSPDSTRRRPGHDFGSVRVHDGAEEGARDRRGGPTIEISPDRVRHPLADALRAGEVRFRVPTFSDLQSVYASKTLKIPESVIQDRVARLLGRMAREKRLKSSDPVADIVKKIFPSPGKIDQTEFENAVDVADRTVIYQSVLDTDTAVKPADEPKLKTAMADAAALVKKVEGDSAGLKDVFGGEAALAGAIYKNTRLALDEVSKDMSKKVSTDYNLDDPELFLGGWANYKARHMHLLLGIVKGTDPAEAKITLIHEAAHLAHPLVDDRGYYGTTGFEALDEKIKVANAGHYEELPRRVLGISSYTGTVFKPGVKKGGGKMTWEDEARREASEHMRKAWDAAVDTHNWLRRVHKEGLKGDKKPFEKDKALILEASKLMDLTIHEQDPASAGVTTLDLTLTEGVARGVSLAGDLVSGQPVTRPKGPFKTPAEELRAGRDQIVADVAAAYGQLLADPARDKKLIDWLVAHYRSLP